jgi:hypothetical protein
MFVSIRLLKRGAEYFLSGVWGFPPASKLPERLGEQGVDLAYSSSLTIIDYGK